MATTAVAAAARKSCQTIPSPQLYNEFYDFCRKGDAEKVKFYLNAGLPADWINERDRNRSVLMATAWKDSEAVCHLLIEQHAPLDHQDSSGMTALHICAKQNSIRVAKRLLEAGANVNLLAENDVTALMICADLGNTELANLLLETPNIRLDLQSSRGFTALMKAVFENKSELACTLIDRGAKLDLASTSGFTALHLCAQLDRRDIASRILAKAGPDLVNRQTQIEFKSNTAFALAALNGHVEMLGLLYDHQADPNLTNSEGYTALDQVKLTGKAPSHLLALLEKYSQDSKVKWTTHHKTQATSGTSLADAIRNDDLSRVRSLAKLATTVDRSTGLTPLILAAGLDKPKALEILLGEIISSSSGATLQVNQQSEDSNKITALHSAVQCGNESCVRLLLDAGASPTVLDADGSTPLHLCADLGSSRALVEMLVERVNAEDLMNSGATGRPCPAKLAAARGHIRVLQPMMLRLCKIDEKRSGDDWLPQILDEARGSFEVASAVLELMPHTQKNSEELTTARLFKAAMDRDTKKVKELLDSSQTLRDNINERSQQDPGWTALMATAWNDDEQTCKLLLDRGADPDVTEQKLRITALHIAVQQDSRRVAKVLLDHRCIGINAKSNDNRTPLIRAAWLNHQDIAKMLLDKNASVNNQEIDGFSALHFCAQENLLELAKLLISHDANLELQTSSKKNCNTAFTLAAVKGHTDMLELLANVGANIYHKSSQGDAIQLAKRAKRAAAIKLLLELDKQRNCQWQAAPPATISSKEPTKQQVEYDAASSEPGVTSASEHPYTDLNSTVVPPICGYQYSMRSNPRGICVIINNEEFLGEEAHRRRGSKNDVIRLEKLFKDDLKFRVQVHHNLDASDIRSVMSSLAASDRHGKFDCFVAFLMSHGEDDRIYGCDYEILALEEVFAPFYNCESLQQKPKLFFVQACRLVGRGASATAESNVDQPASRSGDAAASNPSFERNFSKKMDFLYAYSTTKGDYAYRCSETGSVYIQTLCDVISENYKTHHLCTMLNKVREQLGRTPIPGPNMERVFNLPSETTQLQGEIWFKDFE